MAEIIVDLIDPVCIGKKATWMCLSLETSKNRDNLNEHKKTLGKSILGARAADKNAAFVPYEAKLERSNNPMHYSNKNALKKSKKYQEP